MAEPMRRAPSSSRWPTEDAARLRPVMAAFRMPKETDEEKAARSAAIQAGTSSRRGGAARGRPAGGRPDGAGRRRHGDGEPATRRATGCRRPASLYSAAASVRIANVEINACVVEGRGHRGREMLDELVAAPGPCRRAARGGRGRVQAAPRVLSRACGPPRRGAPRSGAMRIDAIVFDCLDAAPLARFWAAALGWRVAPYDAGRARPARRQGHRRPRGRSRASWWSRRRTRCRAARAVLHRGARAQGREEPRAHRRGGRGDRRTRT